MALYGRFPGLGNTYVVPGRDLARLGLSPAAQLHRGRRLFPKPGVWSAFVGARRSFSTSPARAEVRFGSGEPAGLWWVPFPGAFVAAGCHGMAPRRRTLHWIQHGIAQRR